MGGWRERRGRGFGSASPGRGGRAGGRPADPTQATLLPPTPPPPPDHGTGHPLPPNRPPPSLTRTKAPTARPGGVPAPSPRAAAASNVATGSTAGGVRFRVVMPPHAASAAARRGRAANAAGASAAGPPFSASGARMASRSSGGRSVMSNAHMAGGRGRGQAARPRRAAFWPPSPVWLRLRLCPFFSHGGESPLLLFWFWRRYLAPRGSHCCD